MRPSVEPGRVWGRGIEWDAVLAVLARHTRTPMGHELAAAARPLRDLEAIRLALDLTAEARGALGLAGPPPLDAVPDVRPALDRARMPGSSLDGAELLSFVALLEAAPRLAAYGRRVKSVAPVLAAQAEALPYARELRDALRHALDEEGAVTDRASPRLAQLRRTVRDRRRRIVSELERIVQGLEGGERYVTVRHGRYVIPVRAEARGRVRGIVHDRSQSGQTLFVEPQSVVEANNDLVEAQRAEEAEAARILAELTGHVRVRAADLDRLLEGVGEIDWAAARAQTAERMKATAPVVRADTGVLLRGARHPLLLAQGWEDPARTVVPVDLELDRERPLLVVTGPNAGGKTIALKTLALCALLAHIGCHVPAAEGACVPLLDGLFAIVGDDQSVADNLSTFSAFVKQVREVLALADRGSLVLLDELGAGTDPDDGAALAQAILEELDERGALVMATTHLEPLKVFASTHPRARNASVEFDATTLAPTFRLLYDRPGQSYALAIASRLGLGAELIARAHAHRSAHAARLSELLEQLDASARREAESAIALERRERESAARLEAARRAEAEAEERARGIVARARAESTALVAEIRRSLAVEWERLRAADRSKRTIEESRRRVAGVAARLVTVQPASSPATPELAAGAAVVADHLGLRGELVSVAGAMATVRAGTITVRVPVQALRPAASAPEGAVTPARARGRLTLPEKAGIATELHLIGRTTDEARDLVEHYLDDAFVAGLPSVRLVHGKGTGALRRAVRDLLSAHPLVESFREGEPSEGGAGATVAALKVS